MGDFDHLLKLLMIGDSGVGKTCLLTAFTCDQFDAESRSTIGVDLKVKRVSIQGKQLKLTIWDTAGQERFRTLTNAYYRGAHGVVLAFDVTRRETFDNVRDWMREVASCATRPGVVTMLCANKCDLEDQRVVSTEEALEFARDNAMLFVETSAKTRQGVDHAFTELAAQILQTPELLEPGKPRETVAVTQGDAQTEAPCAC